ncbi:DNA-binding transcriptional regulator, FadR family [Gordonia malaquae]|uniref:Putative GntR family transcriptional regulator n=1 Tax=Gordonia malaquae NBRC 108250 TaxID=1223542 RepID=M3VAZ9_GORML|nr:FCD domain-containing protein [Gordonia malaquae]GAC79393.1 putative GntR family transcriptional regulator [Gordonia malaquae NBRC 108250]SEE29948.1 DNA-binding transcriptional regulator, FadR family [Gordonia malaquae]
MDALTRAPLSQRAAQSLFDEIVGGRWERDQQLPSETALAAELGVGRSTIREAIRLLAARGMLVTRQGVGVFVRSTTPNDSWDRLAEISAIADVLQVRIAIESRAAALAAERNDAGEIAAVRRALDERDRMRIAAPEVLATADVDFHREIVKASGNAPLLALFDSIRPRIVSAMAEFLSLVAVSADDAVDHEGIVSAIADADSERAERVTREHLLSLVAAVSGGVSGATET